MPPWPPHGQRSPVFTCMVVFVGAILTATGTTAGDMLTATPASAQHASSATTDPFFQDGPKIAPDDEVGAGLFGTSVALSADGNTALIGAPDDGGGPGPGSAWVFTRNSSGWSEQAKLIPSDEAGTGQFGASVALSADGNTALIGAPQDTAGDGAAWIFTRSGSTWAQKGSKLAPDDEVGAGHFGQSVALSADGTTALIGSPQNATQGYGWAWVFVPVPVITVFQAHDLGVGRAGAIRVPTQTQWEQQGSGLAPGCCHQTLFGGSVALSSNGNVALVGGGDGTVGAFMRSGSTWGTRWEIYQPSYVQGQNPQFGSSVALSPDGQTAFIGEPADGAPAAGAVGPGALWMFTLLSGQSPVDLGEITQSGGNEASFGSSVTVSQDGGTVVVTGDTDSSGVGAAWVYARTGGTLRQEGGKLTATDESGAGMFGTSSAISVASSTTLLFGGAADSSNTGAAWLFTDAPPAVSSVQPASGPSAGGTVVTVSGSYLRQASGVDFGTVASPKVKVVSADQLSAVSPPGTAGNVDVTVTSPNGTSATSSADVFTYVAPATSTTTRSTTSTTRPKPKPPVSPISAVAVRASVTGHGKDRELEVNFRVSENAQAQLALMARGRNVFSKTFSAVKGANALIAPLPLAVGKGTYVLRLVLKDSHHHHGTYTTLVTVPS